MKLYNFLKISCLALVSIYNVAVASDASSSSDDPYSDFAAAGFKISLLKEVSETPYLSVESVAKLQKHFGGADNIEVIVEHPFADGKNVLNYAPFRSTVEASDKLVPFDTIVMSRYATGQLPDTLTSWVQKGFSTHVFLQLDGRMVFWVDPLRCKGQMAGPWNSRALEILVETNDFQALNEVQIISLGNLATFANTHGEGIKYLLSHGEARGSGTEGTIANIVFGREQLKLSDTNKEHAQTPLSVVKTDEEKAQVKDKTGGQVKSGSWCVVQ